MTKGWLSFVALAVFLTVLHAGCSKKTVPVSGSAGLSGEKSEQPLDGGRPPVSEGVGEQPLDFPASNDQRLLEQKRAENDRAIERNKRLQALANKDSTPVKGLVDVYFDFDRSVLRKESKKALQDNARFLILNQQIKVQIEGHTDERGNNEYNLALGARRARAVKRFLEALGVEKNRISIISFGEEKPFCRKSLEDCWKKNRRAHFKPQS